MSIDKASVVMCLFSVRVWTNVWSHLSILRQ